MAMADDPKIQKAYESILNHDFEQAIGWFEKALAEQPDNASYHYRLSVSYARSNKLIKALEHAKRACTLEPGFADYELHQNTVRARLLLHEASEKMKLEDRTIEEAILLLGEAVSLDPLSIEAYIMLSIALDRAGRAGEALASVKEAIRLDPQHKEANDWLAQLVHTTNHNTHIHN